MLQDPGIRDIRTQRKDGSGEAISDRLKAIKIKDLVASASIEAAKPVQ